MYIKRLTISSGDVVVEATTEEALHRREPDPLSEAQRAATLSLPASNFWLALNLKLIEKGALDVSDDVQEHVLTAVRTAVSEEKLSVADGLAARVLLKTAVTFHRADPQRPGLMDAIGALIDLTAGEIDTLFVETAGAEGSS